MTIDFKRMSDILRAERALIKAEFAETGRCGYMLNGKPCGRQQYASPSGDVCALGHGGAPALVEERALPPWLDKIVVLDFETTGLSPFYNRPIELGLAYFEHGELVRTADYYVNPEGHVVSELITDLTGIVPSDVVNAPAFFEVWNREASHLYGSYPVAYNAGFDRAFLQYSIARAWPRAAFGLLPPLLDPSVRWVDPQYLRPMWMRGSHKLGNVCAEMGVSISQQHRADADAQATGELLYALFADSVNETPPWDWSLDAILKRQQRGSYDRHRKWFFGRQKELDSTVKGWLPKGQSVQCIECDVCHSMRSAVYLKSGWTLPRGWATNVTPHGEVMTCNPGCDLVARWHAGGR